MAYGKGTADFLSQFALGDKRMKDVADGIKDKDEHYIYHEYFEEYNQPLYLSNRAVKPRPLGRGYKV